MECQKEIGGAARGLGGRGGGVRKCVGMALFGAVLRYRLERFEGGVLGMAVKTRGGGGDGGGDGSGY